MAIKNTPQPEKNGYVVVIYKPKAKAHVYLSNYLEETNDFEVWDAPVSRHVFKTEAEAVLAAFVISNDLKFKDAHVLAINALFESQLDEILK